ncbi:uncharacterized protein VP01_362g11 [Puccinia sorghi]|uniref:Integrase catalytic domain-containing protein n=1 Tax=Puccinia sorghi TaxID=27349 RepID=A0A0L6UUU6_9BASI|nr:uncharacterized protein VP01_362g11 [Puccinia sorghi]
MQEKCILGKRSPPYHHFQNRMVEKFNCTLGDMSRTILADSGLNKRFWGFSYMRACHMLNRIPNQSSGIFYQGRKRTHIVHKIIWKYHYVQINLIIRVSNHLPSPWGIYPSRFSLCSGDATENCMTRRFRSTSLLGESQAYLGQDFN